MFQHETDPIERCDWLDGLMDDCHFYFLNIHFHFLQNIPLQKGSNGLDWIDWQVLVLTLPFYHSLSLSTHMCQNKAYPIQICACFGGLRPLLISYHSLSKCPDIKVDPIRRCGWLGGLWLTATFTGWRTPTAPIAVAIFVDIRW